MSAYDLLNGFLFKRLNTCHSHPHACCGALFTPFASGAGRGTHAAMIPPKPGGELKLPIGGRVSTTVTPSQSGGAPFRLPLRSAYPSQGKESANPVFQRGTPDNGKNPRATFYSSHHKQAKFVLAEPSYYSKRVLKPSTEGACPGAA